jgi:tRNA modification GTPase
MKRADIVVYLFDASESQNSQIRIQREELEQDGVKYLLVGNKVDELGLEAAKDKFDADILFISAKERENIQLLKQRLFDIVVEGEIKQEGTVITNARHHHALQQVLGSLADIRSGMDNNIPGDLIALDIRRCLHYLGEITGEVTTEDKLDYIFSKFCIGK